MKKISWLLFVGMFLLVGCSNEKTVTNSSSSSSSTIESSSTVESTTQTTTEETSQEESSTVESVSSTQSTSSEIVYEESSDPQQNAAPAYSEPSSEAEEQPQNSVAVVDPQAGVAEYTIVQKGETPEMIAQRSGISVDQFFELNGFTPDYYMLYPGDQVRVK